MEISVQLADYKKAYHRQCIAELMNHYATDPAGGGEPLNDVVIETTIHEMSQRDYAFTFLAFTAQQALGLANCFESFSTFAGRPIINIHDFVIKKEFRGQGISQTMLKEIEKFAQEKGCCKLTLEVLENNEAAKKSYSKFGFRNYSLDPSFGNALFWQKKLIS